MKKKDNSNKKKNYVMIGVIVGVIAIFGLIIFLIKSSAPAGDNKNGGEPAGKKIDFSIVDDEGKLVKTRFINKAEEEIRQANAKNKQLSSQVKKLEQKISELSQIVKRDLTSRQGQQAPQQNSQPPSPPDRDFSDIFTKIPNMLPAIENTGNKPSINFLKDKEEIYYEFEEVPESLVVGENVQEKTSEDTKKTETVPDDAFFVPAGSIMVAYLDQGFDAPTLKNGRNDLVPATLTVVGYTLLPNNKLYDLRGCKILAESEGKRSNERAYTRTKRLSCVDNENRVMDIPLKGYISDEGGDGKLGLKGNIVSMQNKFLQNAIWIGIVEGLASIGKATAITQTATAQGGVVSTINRGKEFQAGLAGSLADTSSTIKDFLMDNVKSIEPVVEIKGGRLLAVTLSEGIYVYPRIEYGGKKVVR